MMDKSNYKIFLGVREIGGIMERLYHAFQEESIHCEFFCMSEYKFSPDEMERNSSPILKKYILHMNKIQSAESETAKKIWSFLQMLDIIKIFIYALLHFKQYIYVFGQGMFSCNIYLKHVQRLEFLILKAFHKKVIVWLCGSDSRAPYCGVDIYNGELERIWKAARYKKKKISMLEKYAVLIDNPASSHFHSKPYVVFSKVGIPVDKGEKVSADVCKEKENGVVILHAPSSKFKGTCYIRKAVEELKKEGYEIEYTEVTGVSHQCVLEQISKADIVVDEVFSDTPMGGLAAEAAYNGVPVVVAGEFSRFYKEELPEPIPPTVFCTIEEIKEKIIWLIQNPQERIRIGREGQQFVEQNYLSNIVAGRFCAILDGNIPDDWLFSPNDNIYPFGCGLHKNDVIKNVVHLIDKYGEESLCLPRESRLFQIYLEMYEQHK